MVKVRCADRPVRTADAAWRMRKETGAVTVGPISLGNAVK